MLPLDLHVLSLPLAFILSQDQTLHCKCCLILTCIILKNQRVKSKLYSLDLPLVPFRFASEQSAIVSLLSKIFRAIWRTHFFNGSAKVRALYF